MRGWGRRVGPSGGEARVSREREKFGSECDLLGSESRQTLLGTGVSDRGPRSYQKDRCPAGETPDQINWVTAK